MTLVFALISPLSLRSMSLKTEDDYSSCGNACWKIANNFFKYAPVIVIAYKQPILVVSSEARRDRSPTLSQDSRPRDRVHAAKDQSSGNNLINLGPRNSVPARRTPMTALWHFVVCPCARRVFLHQHGPYNVVIVLVSHCHQHLHQRRSDQQGAPLAPKGYEVLVCSRSYTILSAIIKNLSQSPLSVCL